MKHNRNKWTGVTSNQYQFGGVEFMSIKEKWATIHGEKLADPPFPIKLRKEIIDSGKALPHIVYPESMWVSYIVHNEENNPRL